MAVCPYWAMGYMTKRLYCENIHKSRLMHRKRNENLLCIIPLCSGTHSLYCMGPEFNLFTIVDERLGENMPYFSKFAKSNPGKEFWTNNFRLRSGIKWKFFTSTLPWSWIRMSNSLSGRKLTMKVVQTMYTKRQYSVGKDSCNFLRWLCYVNLEKSIINLKWEQWHFYNVP